MLIRATIVLLAVLNLGAAAWWLWKPDPAPVQIAQPPGVPRLVLLEEIAAASTPTAEPADGMPAEGMPATAPPAGETTPADAAFDAEPPVEPTPRDAPRSERPEPPAEPETLAGQPRCEGGGEGEARGWRVDLPPAADLAAARELAQRIADAGFSDYLVLTDGVHANGIALGMFSTEAGAQRRRAALRDAGFPARCARIAPSTPA